MCGRYRAIGFPGVNRFWKSTSIASRDKKTGLRATTLPRLDWKQRNLVTWSALVAVLCWSPSRRLVKAAPLPCLARISPVGLAGIMTIALLISCILFMAGQGVIGSHELLLYWLTKVGAIFLALFAMARTLSSMVLIPQGSGFSRSYFLIA